MHVTDVSVLQQTSCLATALIYTHKSTLFYLFVRGGLHPALRPSINCSPNAQPDTTKG